LTDGWPDSAASASLIRAFLTARGRNELKWRGKKHRAFNLLSRHR